ncbi:MAG: sigma-70 family RNA polymerase sigma factor [Dehalococcoidia bacterium]|nr:MAG: sigma-70 family RNA polymerase sigma factor [Dehalococcoidia bacterium]
MQDEQELVKRAQQHNEEAFSELYELYFDKIYRYISLKIGNRIEAEDMTQQVFIKALHSISSFRWRGFPFSAWLFRIAHNLVVDHFRKKTRQPVSALDDTVIVADDSPEKLAELKLDIEKLAMAVKKLTPAQQEVIALRFSSEFPIAQVAEIMGKSEGAVKALQHSAVVSLRKILNVV